MVMSIGDMDTATEKKVELDTHEGLLKRVLTLEKNCRALRKMGYSEFEILKLNEFGLQYDQVCTLTKNVLVDDTIIEGLYSLIRLEHPSVVGLESTVLRFHKFMRQGNEFNNQPTAHIYHTGSNHFVSAVQTCKDYIEFSDSIYGKKPVPPSPTVLEQMKVNFKSRDKKGKLPIRSHCVQKQTVGNLDCGLF